MKIKRFVTIAVVFVLMMSSWGCGPKRIALNPDVNPEIAILPLGADTSNLNQDQIDLLNKNLQYMERDIMNNLKRMGLSPYVISDENDFANAPKGHLLKYEVIDHKIIPTVARFGFGMMAGADRWGVHFDLIDANNNLVASWDDTKSSTQGVVKCIIAVNKTAYVNLSNHYQNL